MSKTSSRRTQNRISSALFIEDRALPSKLPCSRCTQKGLACFSLKDGRCSCCVRSGVEKGCNAEMSSRTDKSLKEQKEALRKAQSDVAEASARLVRLQKVVDRLESKSKTEFDAAMAEIESENQADDSGDGPSSGDKDNTVSEGTSTSPSLASAWAWSMVEQGLDPALFADGQPF
jgi:hypothetical protein